LELQALADEKHKENLPDHLSQAEIAHRAGQGNWGAFRRLSLDVSLIREVAKSWERQFAGIRRPWLCWNVDDEWCLVQQRLVLAAGWTPVIGYDPRVGPPRKIAAGAIVVNFNEGLGLPVLYPHFPLEFAFLFTDRIAFWHSDLLVRMPLMRALAQSFSTLEDGRTAVTACSPGLRHMFSIKKQRYWELIGCTTRAASKSQFDKGCGWWMAFWDHPNCPSAAERERRRRYNWDHGSGIYYWHKKMGGDVTIIKDKSLHEGHFTKIGKKNYVRSTPLLDGSDAQRSMNQEMNANFSLAAACRSMGLAEWTDQP
jgi:hypothetical protein